tara:strand:+ start:69 stop:251 length:183 start_codon:yes stop_codon:yes gene_type:complete
MSASLLLALLCSYGAVFLFGMFIGMTEPARKESKNIKEYRKHYEEEMRNVHKPSWDHPRF